MTQEVRFCLNDAPASVAVADPTLSVLDWLREERGLVGSKEGCAEGDCGACTVVLGRLENGRLRRRAVNACLLFMPELDGGELITVEGLGGHHPIQQAMVDCHASQCGYCTPGFVMALYGHHLEGGACDRASLRRALAGNLCRCTGYGPILDAGEALAGLAPPDSGASARRLEALQRAAPLVIEGQCPVSGAPKRYGAPRTTAELMELMARWPEATLLAGGTDVGLWVTKQHRRLDAVIALGRIEELQRIEETADAIVFGAGVRLAEVHARLGALHPDLDDVLRRFGSVQVRNSGTLGGNIANGSPIGDSMPPLIALGATLVLHAATGRRELPLEDYFLAYGKQDRAPGEIVAAVRVPRPGEDAIFACHKFSKRFEQDISAVCAALMLKIEDGVIRTARIAFGGMAATPKRSGAAEAALLGRPLDSEALDAAAVALAEDFTPIDDFRASAAWRMTVAENFLRETPEREDSSSPRHSRAAGPGLHAMGPLAPSSARPGEDSGVPGRRPANDAAREHNRTSQPLPHDSAALHVAGTARYIDDLAEPRALLHVHLAQSPHAHARIRSIDLDAVRAAPGVVCVLTAADIPGHNQIGAVRADEPLLAEDEVVYAGQPVFAVAAETRARARAAAALAVIDYEPLPAILTIAQARAADSVLEPCQVMQRGDWQAALGTAPHRLAGRLAVGGQDHFYLEGQVAMALPGEADTVEVLSSTQHPSEMQHLVARLLGRADHAVRVEVRRMGGGFGGKESQSSICACTAALVAAKTGRPAKLRLGRDDDMIITGKRHEFEIGYEVGFDDEGRILGIDIDLAARCGHATDLSLAVSDRAMFHADNACYLPAVRIRSHRFRTHTVSNTAFRGFGGPQGMMAIERVLDHIAGHLGRDPLEVRRANLYAPGRATTPYGQAIEEHVLPDLVDELARRADYARRRAAIANFNAGSRRFKRGIALTPVKFGISFTTTHLNQAGALVHVYTDGSVQLHHGGTEMGQGLMVKVAGLVADAFGLPPARVRINATDTGKVPNTSATAASSGADLNGMAALAAATTIRDRLAAFAAEKHGVEAARIRFDNGQVFIGNSAMPFEELVRAAWQARIQLSATGFYRTPKLHYDSAARRGRPFYYFACGAAVSEVVVDVSSGEYRLLRVDILHDVGRSLNEAIDRGQIEGGFIQGMGWLTMEELVWSEDGRLLTHAPSTYKIPTAGDRPDDFRIDLYDSANRENTVGRSKAVGEPPLMLAISVFSALGEAVRAGGGDGARLDAPATPERVLKAMAAMAPGADR